MNTRIGFADVVKAEPRIGAYCAQLRPTTPRVLSLAAYSLRGEAMTHPDTDEPSEDIGTRDEIGQLTFRAVVDNPNRHETAQRYREATREILRRVRDGRAEKPETELLAFAVTALQRRAMKPEQQRKLYALAQMYLVENPKTAREVAEQTNVSLSTLFRDIARISEKLAVLMFGIDAIDWG
jgi:DNA invertase Pin-like site-specific DNA recombinase